MGFNDTRVRVKEIVYSLKVKSEWRKYLSFIYAKTGLDSMFDDVRVTTNS